MCGSVGEKASYELGGSGEARQVEGHHHGLAKERELHQVARANTPARPNEVLFGDTESQLGSGKTVAIGRINDYQVSKSVGS
jgi:hypothetical protein